jgi:2'-hydroxyisoflavone reductase
MTVTRRTFLQGASSLLFACGARSTTGGGPLPRPPQPPSPPPAAPAPKQLLILGGTQFLGPSIVEAALARGHTVTLFNRGKTNPHLFPDLEKLHGDRDGKLDALKGRSWDAVIDTSGYVPRIVKMSAELLAPSVGHYLFISTISVYADPVPVGADVGAPLATIPDPTNEDVRANYGALKALCEQAAEAAMPGRVATVRPGLIVGPGDPTDRFTYWPVRMERGGDVLAPGDGRDPVQFVDVRDLGAWIVALAEQRTAGVFHATGPDTTLTMKELLGACARAAGTTPTLTWVPAAFLEQQNVSPWMDMPVWVPGTGDSAGFARLNASKAIAAGLRFRPAEDTARATLTWWRSEPEERRRAQLRAGLAPEREGQVLAEWRKRGGSAPT